MQQQLIIDEIKTFKFKKGNGHRAKGGPGKTCNKCSTSHPPRECPAWGKKCHKCGNKNHLVCVVGPGTEKIPKTETNTDQPIESHEAKGEAGAGIGDMHQRTQRTDPEVDLPPKVPTA